MYSTWHIPIYVCVQYMVIWSTVGWVMTSFLWHQQGLISRPVLYWLWDHEGEIIHTCTYIYMHVIFLKYFHFIEKNKRMHFYNSTETVRWKQLLYSHISIYSNVSLPPLWDPVVKKIFFRHGQLPIKIFKNLEPPSFEAFIHGMPYQHIFVILSPCILCISWDFALSWLTQKWVISH